MTLLLFGGGSAAPRLPTTVAPGGLFDVVARAATGQSLTLTVQIVDGASVVVGAVLHPVSETPATGGQADYLFRATAPTILGGYTVEVVGGDGATDTQPLAVAGYRPSVQDVAALLHARTIARAGTVGGGTPVGTFDERTPVTGAQVETLIDLAVSDTRAQIGQDPPDEWFADARAVAVLRAATLIEGSFWPNEVEAGRSMMPQLQAMYLGGVERLASRIGPRGLYLA